MDVFCNFFAERNELSFIETSALDSTNVEAAFQNILSGKLHMKLWENFSFLITFISIFAFDYLVCYKTKVFLMWYLYAAYIRDLGAKQFLADWQSSITTKLHRFI